MPVGHRRCVSKPRSVFATAQSGGLLATLTFPKFTAVGLTGKLPAPDPWRRSRHPQPPESVQRTTAARAIEFKTSCRLRVAVPSFLMPSSSPDKHCLSLRGFINTEVRVLASMTTAEDQIRTGKRHCPGGNMDCPYCHEGSFCQGVWNSEIFVSRQRKDNYHIKQLKRTQIRNSHSRDMLLVTIGQGKDMLLLC